MRKRTLSLALAVSMAAMSLAGCGAGDPSFRDRPDPQEA